VSLPTQSVRRGISARQACWLFLVLGFVALYVVQRKIDTELGIYAKISDILYVPAGTNLRRLSLGNEGLLADIYWTRAVQYYGRNHMPGAGGRNELLAPLLRITTDLDPHLLIAYRFGAIFLAGKPPAGAGEPEAALELIRRGIVANPDYWRLWQDLGFIYYWEFKDYKTAARIFTAGSRMPGAGFWMKALAGTVAEKGGDLQTSRFLWSEIYEHAETDDIRKNAEEHLTTLAAVDQMNQLNSVLDMYRTRTGKEPQSFSDLYAIGLLRGIPRDPLGVPYVIGPDGHAELGPSSQINMVVFR
jgi:hypothetical protein